MFLTGCGPSFQYSPAQWFTNGLNYPPYEGAGFTERDWTERERLVSRADFTAEIVHLTDNRRQRTLGGQPNDLFIYQYDADQLLQGMTYRVPVLFNKYMTFRPRAPKHYLIELEVIELLPHIRKGTLLSGSWGRYEVTTEIRVIARRPDSRVALNKVYRFTREQRRESFNGRSPSAEMDRSRLYDMVEDAIRLTTEHMMWNIRQKDARFWEVKDQPQPFQMAPAGTTSIEHNANTPLEGSLPLQMGAPNEPANQAEAPLQLPDDANTPLLPTEQNQAPIIPPYLPQQDPIPPSQLLKPNQGPRA